MMDNEQAIDGTNLTSIPVSNPPKSGVDSPQHHLETNNLAGDKELTDTLWEHICTNIETFRSQGMRRKQCQPLGVLDIADRMYRIALRRDNSNSQHQDTLSDFTSGIYYKETRAVSAGETTVFFSNGMPAKYEPVLDSSDYNIEQGKWLANQQNMMEEYGFEEDNRQEKIENSILYNNKNGNEMVSIEWNRIVEEYTERVPVEWSDDDDSIPTRFEFKTVKRVKKDCPELNRWPLEDCYFDAQIDDMNLQRQLSIRKYWPYEKFEGDQEQGFIMNVDKISTSMLYQGIETSDTGDDNVKYEKELNAGIETTSESNGLYVVWDNWVRVPIKESKTKGKGKWDPNNTSPKLYWATYVGEKDGPAVCIRLIKNPYFHKQIPYRLLHSLPDDIGAYHMSSSQMLESMYWQIVTNWNQAADNVTMRNKAPYVADGRVHTRDLTFKANKLIRTARGVSLKPIETPKTTEITLNLAQMLESECDKIVGTDKPILGEALGGRTSATEARRVFDQSQKPLLVKADYVAHQLFTWMYEIDACLWRQFGDPEKIYLLTKNNMQEVIQPTNLWGNIKVKITSVLDFESNAEKRINYNAFIQNGYQLAAPIMQKAGETKFWTEAFEVFGFKDVNELVPGNSEVDSEYRALNDIYQILEVGNMVEPEYDQNQQVHLRVEKQQLREYELLPNDEIDPNRLNNLKLHIAQEEAILQEKQNVSQQNQNQQNQNQQMAETPSDVEANQISSMEGARANL